MSGRVRSAVVVAALAVNSVGAAGSAPARPKVRDEGAAPRSCADAVAAAFPDGRRGTLPAYREVERRGASSAELAERQAVDASVVSIDCGPADVPAPGGEIPQLGGRVPSAPPDPATMPVCGQFNVDCADDDELRRDHAAARTPPLANLGLYTHHRRLFDDCVRRYGGRS